MKLPGFDPDAGPWPELTIAGDTRAPRGWNFYLSDEEDQFGPMRITAVDEGGQARAYCRQGYIPKNLSSAMDLMGWAMLVCGAGIGYALATAIGEAGL